MADQCDPTASCIVGGAGAGDDAGHDSSFAGFGDQSGGSISPIPARPSIGSAEADGAGVHEVRDIRSGDQESADPATWSPPDADRAVSIVVK